MAKNTTTCHYLEKLGDGGYGRVNELRRLFDEWQGCSDVGALSRFLDIVAEERDNIKPRYLGQNEYNNLRGTAFEEFCFHLLRNAIKRVGLEDAVALFWNERIVTEQYYVFENGRFRTLQKSKAVDLVVGQSEDELVHPFMIASCKIWQSTPWLDEDRAVLDNLKNRYPGVVGYSLTRSVSAPPVSRISAQRTGLRLFDLSQAEEFAKFQADVDTVLKETKDHF